MFAKATVTLQDQRNEQSTERFFSRLVQGNLSVFRNDSFQMVSEFPTFCCLRCIVVLTASAPWNPPQKYQFKILVKWKYIKPAVFTTIAKLFATFLCCTFLIFKQCLIHTRLQRPKLYLFLVLLRQHCAILLAYKDRQKGKVTSSCLFTLVITLQYSNY